MSAAAPPQAAGKFVILYFYPKDDTPGCTLEGRDFSELSPQFQAAGGLLFGVSRDNIRSHENFRQKYNYAHHLLSDDEGVLCRRFDLLKEKMMFGKKVFGIVRSTFIISPDGYLAAEWRDIKDVAGHAAAVLEELKKLKKSRASSGAA